ncbi:hypothetical protein D3C80_1237740 [compost metagenome]
MLKFPAIILSARNFSNTRPSFVASAVEIKVAAGGSCRFVFSIRACAHLASCSSSARLLERNTAPISCRSLASISCSLLDLMLSRQQSSQNTVPCGRVRSSTSASKSFSALVSLGLKCLNNRNNSRTDSRAPSKTLASGSGAPNGSSKLRMANLKFESQRSKFKSCQSISGRLSGLAPTKSLTTISTASVVSPFPAGFM